MIKCDCFDPERHGHLDDCEFAEIERLRERLAEAERLLMESEIYAGQSLTDHGWGAMIRWREQLLKFWGATDSADVSLPEAKPCTCASYCLVKTGGKFLGHVVCRGLPGDDQNGHLRLRR